MLSALFPLTARPTESNHLELGGCDVVALAEKFGTPLYIFDEATIRAQAARALNAFRSRWNDVVVLYATKAYFAPFLARLYHELGVGLDVTSEAEIVIAKHAGFDSEKIYVHGNNKTPEEIRAKAERLYPYAIAAWLRGEDDFFPRAVPANLKPSPDYSRAARDTQAIRARSKEMLGHGYSVQWENRRSRRYGEQNFPVAIEFETRDDLLRLIGKASEFRRLARAVESLRDRQPKLGQWCEANWRRLLAIEAELPQLLDVVAHLQTHPRPGCFIRELPLAISTKLIEENSSILAQWLDVLTPDAIDFAFGRDQFAQRYGFRSPDDQLWLRLLDDNMLEELCCPGSELALPLTTLAGLPVRDANVIIVENKVNLLTLPPLPRTLALGGLGRGVTQLFRIPWLETAPIAYWGDIDVEGLQILAHVRSRWPQVRSLMMDIGTLEHFSALVISGNTYPPELAPPSELTADEQAAFMRCRDASLRLEQERIPQAAVNERLSTSPTSFKDESESASAFLKSRND